MKINLYELSLKFSEFGFYLLFPGFFIYHFCVSQDFIPAFLGGLFGNISAVIAFVSFLFLPWFLKFNIKGVQIPVIYFYFSIFFFVSWTLGNHFLVQNHPYGFHSFWESYSSFIIWAAMFFIGFFIPIESSKFYNILLFCCFVIFVIFIGSILRENSFFALFKYFQNSADSSAISSYQQAGRSVLVSFLFLSLIGHNSLFNFLCLLVSSVILLSIGSRTDLVSVFLVVVLYCFHMLLIGEGSILRKFIFIASFFILLLITYVLTQTLFYDSRAAELFDLASSSSWQGRSDLSTNAYSIIKKYPIFGKFDYYDVEGGYAHNILSAWTSFGLFGFLIYIVLLFYFLIFSGFYYLFSNRFKMFWFLVFSLNCITFLQALIAAPIFYALPALGWGLTLNVYKKAKSVYS